MLPLIHYAHLLLATLWLGGTLTLYGAVYPALARLAGAQAALVYDGIGRGAQPLLGAAGGLTLLLGPLRAVLGGRISGLADLAQPYTHMVGTAFGLMLASVVLDARFRRRFRALMADAAYGAQAPARVTRATVVQVVLLLAILAIMVALGLALY